ncbi:MAG: DUF362 domain-containing protein [Nitrospirae bacterium]|nr:DUF362 domain-containing protein [Nitrospirota bacterium]
MAFKLNIITAYSAKEIKERLFLSLQEYHELLPASKTSKILLKPNLNANMNALTGNTTDLRLLAAVIEYLKVNGYKNIAIGEGTNSGYYRNNISVISRLKIDELAKYYGVKAIDFNFAEPVYIAFENGVKAGIAKDCAEADFIINMPKLKTHFEVGMSVCLKNLMGCLVGQENKKKTHQSLARNILNINEHLKPNFHIVDGLIAMEGLGPTRGKPKKMGIIILGANPYLIDLLCAKIANFDYRLITTLKLAEDKGLITKDYHEFIQSQDINDLIKEFEKPKANFFASFIHSPKRQKYFLAVRNTKFFTYLAATELFGKLLFLSGLRQDNFIKEEMSFEGFSFDKGRCTKGCTKCKDYCPVGLELPEGLAEHRNNGCIGCLYCFLVCPTKAIEFGGKLGFLTEQIRQYDDITRKVA